MSGNAQKAPGAAIRSPRGICKSGKTNNYILTLTLLPAAVAI